MKYITLPENQIHRLSFYLAMEEYVARNIVTDDAFFMWQVRPTVIFGRNQSVANEVNQDYCRQNGIEMYRRKSGGGCVYADMGNVMCSFVTKDENVNLTFNRFVNMMLLVLRTMGIEAASTTHNDILIGNQKVSGTAFYHLPGSSIVHATLLYDTHMDHMTHAITPSKQKLQQKGIQSVRQRITLLKDHTTLSLDEVKAIIRATLCDDELILTPVDVSSIETIEQSYLNQDFINHLT